MPIYRVVCSKTPNSKDSSVIIDFANADPTKATLTHQQLFKIRKYETPEAEWIIPPAFIEETKDGISIYFDKPEETTTEQFEQLSKLAKLIKCSYNKFKFSGKENSLELTDHNIAFVYDDVDPYQQPQTEKQRLLFERIKRSIRINRPRPKVTIEPTSKPLPPAR